MAAWSRAIAPGPSAGRNGPLTSSHHDIIGAGEGKIPLRTGTVEKN